MPDGTRLRGGTLLIVDFNSVSFGFMASQPTPTLPQK